MEVINIRYISLNLNPSGRIVGDCVIRAIAKATNRSWEDIYSELVIYGFSMYNLPSANIVWGTYLIENGFEEHTIPRRCENCYTIADFCEDHPKGTYIVGTDDHAVAVIDSIVYDVFDSRYLVPTYYFEKKENENNE